MFENFNIWNCFAKMLDSMLLVLIPVRVLAVRKTQWRKWMVFVPSFIAVSIILYGVDMVFKPVKFIITLILQTTVGMFYAHIFFRGRFHLKLILQCTCVCCTILFHYINTAHLFF